MVMQLSDIISKVQKLLRVADSSDKPGEVSSAQSLAQELITKYQIEEAQLHDHIGEGNIVARRIETPKPYAIDKSVLLNSIAKHNFCKVLRGEEYCMIYGYKSDIELCLTLYNILSLDMVNEMFIKLNKIKKNSKEKIHTKTWVKGFFGGYCITINERIRESKTKVINETNNTSVALVVRNKQHAIEEYFQKLDRHPATQRKIVASSGYNDGIDSGMKANINQSSIER
jgi:hypothetical protein